MTQIKRLVSQYYLHRDKRYRLTLIQPGSFLFFVDLILTYGPSGEVYYLFHRETKSLLPFC